MCLAAHNGACVFLKGSRVRPAAAGAAPHSRIWWVRKLGVWLAWPAGALICLELAALAAFGDLCRMAANKPAT